MCQVVRLQSTVDWRGEIIVVKHLLLELYCCERCAAYQV